MWQDSVCDGSGGIWGQSHCELRQGTTSIRPGAAQRKAQSPHRPVATSQLPIRLSYTKSVSLGVLSPAGCPGADSAPGDAPVLDGVGSQGVTGVGWVVFTKLLQVQMFQHQAHGHSAKYPGNNETSCRSPRPIEPGDPPKKGCSVSWGCSLAPRRPGSC